MLKAENHGRGLVYLSKNISEKNVVSSCDAKTAIEIIESLKIDNSNNLLDELNDTITFNIVDGSMNYVRTSSFNDSDKNTLTIIKNREKLDDNTNYNQSDLLLTKNYSMPLQSKNLIALSLKSKKILDELEEICKRAKILNSELLRIQEDEHLGYPRESNEDFLMHSKIEKKKGPIINREAQTIRTRGNNLKNMLF